MQHLVLKILAGPNAGAEALLRGRTVVGSSEAADVAIADPELAAEHFAIVVEGEAVSVAVGDAPVTIGGEARRNGTFRLVLFDLIKFGTTCCAVGPEGAAWPAFKSADLLPPPPPVEEAPVVDNSTVVLDAPPAPPSEEPVVVRPPRKSRVGLALVVLFLLLLVGGGYFLVGNFIDGDGATAKRATAQDIVTAQQADGVTVRSDGKDGVVAEGFVATTEQQRRLRQALLDADIVVKYRVVSLEQQVSAVRTIVTASGARLAVEGDPKTGKILLDGFLPELSHVETLQRVLSRDIADLRPIETRIVTPDRVRSDVQAQVDIAGLQNAATVQLTGTTVRITGALPDEGRAAVRRIANDLSQRWAPMVKVEDATTLAGTVAAPAPQPVPIPRPTADPVTVKASPPPVKIVIVVGGKDGFVRDEAGRRYGVGDKLANGEIIEEIRVEEIVTSRDGIKYRYTFGGGH